MKLAVGIANGGVDGRRSAPGHDLWESFTGFFIFVSVCVCMPTSETTAHADGATTTNELCATLGCKFDEDGTCIRCGSAEG